MMITCSVVTEAAEGVTGMRAFGVADEAGAVAVVAVAVVEDGAMTTIMIAVEATISPALRDGEAGTTMIMVARRDVEVADIMIDMIVAAVIMHHLEASTTDLRIMEWLPRRPLLLVFRWALFVNIHFTFTILLFQPPDDRLEQARKVQQVCS
jgi:hypothetical protein